MATLESSLSLSSCLMAWCVHLNYGSLMFLDVQMSAVFKLAIMVNSCMWNEVGDVLVAVADERLVVWYYPHVAYVDKDLLQYVKITQDQWGLHFLLSLHVKLFTITKYSTQNMSQEICNSSFYLRLVTPPGDTHKTKLCSPSHKFYLYIVFERYF